MPGTQAHMHTFGSAGDLATAKLKLALQLTATVVHASLQDG
jgi:hypothetical protein